MLTEPEESGELRSGVDLQPESLPAVSAGFFSGPIVEGFWDAGGRAVADLVVGRKTTRKKKRAAPKKKKYTESCVTKPPGCVTKAPGCVTKKPGC
jgi:hypothetical protein